MKKNLIEIIAIVYSTILIISCFTTATRSEDYIPSELTNIENQNNYSINQMASLSRPDSAMTLLDGIEEPKLIVRETIENLKAFAPQVIETVPQTNFNDGEYPIAIEIWNYLKGLGYNDYVCAGILGNMMAEVGGNTLYIQYWLYDSSHIYYGMCQWNVNYYSEVEGTDLYSQLDFLMKTIKYEIDTFGFKYQKGFKYEDFINLTNYEEAALAFAKSYERCAAKHYRVRQTNAKVAYDYFVN